MLRRFLVFLPGLALAACSFEATGPVSDLDILPPGLDIRFAVEPGEVLQHAPFNVKLTLSNTTSDTIKIVTSHGCLSTPHFYRNGKRVPMSGSDMGCTAAITTHTFPPGETRSFAWPMRAEFYAEQAGDVEGAPAPTGTYLVRAEFDIGHDTAPGVGRAPAAEVVLRVK